MRRPNSISWAGPCFGFPDPAAQRFPTVFLSSDPIRLGSAPLFDSCGAPNGFHPWFPKAADPQPAIPGKLLSQRSIGARHLEASPEEDPPLSAGRFRKSSEAKPPFVRRTNGSKLPLPLWLQPRLRVPAQRKCWVSSTWCPAPIPLLSPVALPPFCWCPAPSEGGVGVRRGGGRWGGRTKWGSLGGRGWRCWWTSLKLYLTWCAAPSSLGNSMPSS